MWSGRILVAFAALGLILCGCDRAEPGHPSSAPAADSPNVLLITLDTTRADRLGATAMTALVRRPWMRWRRPASAAAEPIARCR
jgi:predicted small integral membrane protein